MTAACLPTRGPLRAVTQEPTPGSLLLDALTRFASMSGAGVAAVVLQFSDGEVISDVELDGGQAAALAEAVDTLTRPQRQEQAGPGRGADPAPRPARPPARAGRPGAP
jgi:hypothetical protein